jgi:hypothetical protein
VVVHRLRGRPSNRKLAERTRSRVLRLIEREYRDFGPTLIAEYLQSGHGIGVGKETVRKWMIGAGLWKPKRARVAQVHSWRARRESRGELVQWDTSVHAWLEDRGPAVMYLVGMIYDATNTLHARFVEADTTEQNLRVLGVIWSATGGRRPSTPTKRACFSPPWRGAGRGTIQSPRPRRRLEERYASWESSGSRRILHKPKDAWNAVSEPCKTGWSKRCARPR